MKGRTLLTVAVSLLVAAFAGWYFASPWWTLRSMRDAARARDSERLVSYIDFPAVRQSVRDELAEGLEKRLPGFLSKALVAKLGTPVVDAIVSPDVLSAALIARPEGGEGSGQDNCGLTRESFSEFRLRCAKITGGQADLIFHRRGLGWVLVGIDLPADFKVKSLNL